MDGQNFNEVSTNNEGGNNKTLAIVSLVLGILAIVIGCCFTWLGIILGIAAIVCGVLANKQGKTGLATAGIICGAVGLVFAIIWLILGAVMGAALTDYLAAAGYSY